jgi:hypothetical protein
VDRQHRVEEVREPDALCLGDKAEEAAVTVEAPGPALFHDFEPSLVVAVHQFIRDLPRRALVREHERLAAKPLHVDNGDQGIGQDASNDGVRL